MQYWLAILAYTARTLDEMYEMTVFRHEMIGGTGARERKQTR